MCQKCALEKLNICDGKAMHPWEPARFKFCVFVINLTLKLGRM